VTKGGGEKLPSHTAEAGKRGKNRNSMRGAGPRRLERWEKRKRQLSITSGEEGAAEEF